MTLVFVHGFCMTADAWHFQRQDLADLGRTVGYDQRAHGRSGPSDVEHCTIAQLADDLHRVLDDRAPTGPIVLIGHSMGGMTVLGLAEPHPELFGDRIIAVALLSTRGRANSSAWRLGLPAIVTAAARQRGGCRRDTGAPQVPEPVVDSLIEMIASTPIPVIGAFLPTLVDHDRLRPPACCAIPSLREKTIPWHQVERI
ncbi:alpha/beta fold hydrolase [Frankia gtarii]|uniref:alpha/beta fold hydrolase n=1 Tax=Frankia gtarii TaxID=2950102 RepID=UPI0021C11A48|nr:alpha/beta hydrolase [Frankia gtarii]